MKPELKRKARVNDDDDTSPPKRARKGTGATKRDNDNDNKNGPGITTMTFNTDQEDCLYDLHINKMKLKDIHDYFVKEYDFEGSVKSLENCIYKLKAQRTNLSEEDKLTLHDILDKLVLDRTQLVLDQFHKASTTKVTKQFMAKFIKDWEIDKSNSKAPKITNNKNEKKPTEQKKKKEKTNGSTQGKAKEENEKEKNEDSGGESVE